jgi:hypothetical protein
MEYYLHYTFEDLSNDNLTQRFNKDAYPYNTVAGLDQSKTHLQ